MCHQIMFSISVVVLMVVVIQRFTVQDQYTLIEVDVA